jgi:beta-mannosidase
MRIAGVNWTPIRATFADLDEADYASRIATYKSLGFNLLRVWGGAVLEREIFYRHCDQAGLLVWQEMPLSSSGIDNWPPESARAIADLAAVTASYVTRRQHHASLLMWCGGNELQGGHDGGKVGIGRPATGEHPLLARLAEVVAELDPGRRFLPTSACGPRFMADAADYGKGLHWDVHGPWRVEGGSVEAHHAYFAGDDSLLRSEVGVAGASPAPLIRQYAGGFSPVPGTVDNPLWRRTSWWVDWPQYVAETGAEPETLEAFVRWSQQRQADGLRIAAERCLARFPACGGFIIWMGHDAFPCTANTSILDFHGEPKPAAHALAAVIHAHRGDIG